MHTLITTANTSAQVGEAVHVITHCLLYSAVHLVITQIGNKAIISMVIIINATHCIKSYLVQSYPCTLSFYCCSNLSMKIYAIYTVECTKSVNTNMNACIYIMEHLTSLFHHQRYILIHHLSKKNVWQQSVAQSWEHCNAAPLMALALVSATDVSRCY